MAFQIFKIQEKLMIDRFLIKRTKFEKIGSKGKFFHWEI